MFTRVAVSALALVTLSTASAFADDSFGTHLPGQHVYDRANVLRADQLQNLETRAAKLDALGAPTVIYLRVESASQAQAQQEARELMDAWDVESSHGAHDGFVMLFDLTPGNTEHGQVAMFAGAKHTNAESLDADELNRIASDVMRPQLARGDLAAGIRAGLDATADDLRGEGSTTDQANSDVVKNLPFFASLPIVAIIVLVTLFTLPFLIIAFVASMIRHAVRGGGDVQVGARPAGPTTTRGRVTAPGPVAAVTAAEPRAAATAAARASERSALILWFMLAYVFWHWPKPELSQADYEQLQRAFHAALAAAKPAGFMQSTAFRVEGRAAWLAGSPAYADWYLVDEFAALGPLNAQAVSGICEAPHTAVAHAMAAGAGSLLTLHGDAAPPDVTTTRRVTWLTKPREVPYDQFYAAVATATATQPTSLWRRAMVLGPTPEFALLAADAPPISDIYQPLPLTFTPISLTPMPVRS
jgi:uncharacterized membrane protein YgcG